MNIQQRMISNDLGIENNWQIVVETVDAEEIINYLPSLQEQDRYSIIQDKIANGRMHANRLLIDIINKYGLLNEFLQALHQTGYQHLLEFLSVSQGSLARSQGRQDLFTSST